jgi:DNA (cytosine-5)-methyltransferase 1
MRVGSLCTGIGGAELALEAMGLEPELMWYAEIDPAACQVLEARWPGVLNLGDITRFEFVPMPPVAPIDVLTAGYPCQPFSTAGKRKGTDDPRHLWPHVFDAIRVLRPRIAFLENVAGHLSLGFDVVLGDLASIGFDAEWATLRASDVGACHGRDRLWIVATNPQRGGVQ